MIGDKHNFISLYRSPSQSNDVIESLADNLELNLNVTESANCFFC